MTPRVAAAAATEEPATSAMRPPGPLAWGLVALAILVAGLIFGARFHRPLEQGGDAYSDANAMLAGQNFVKHGFAKLHFLPVVVPDPSTPVEPDEYYTHYPPGADLLNGVLRALGLRRVEAWRAFSACVSLAGLIFWFLALRRVFGDAVALAGVWAYALNFSFLWLGDSIHHYGYSDFLRSLAFWLGVKHAQDDARPRDTALLCVALFAQSLLAYDYLPATHVLLLMIGATGFRGERLKRLLLFAAMPVLGVGLHLGQNAWALGGGASFADMRGAFLERAFASGAGDFQHFTPIGLLRTFLRDTQQLMGVGFGAIAGFALFGAAAWSVTAPPGPRERGLRVVGAVAVSCLLWFVLMHQHAGEHPYSDRQVLPLASLAFALGLTGIGSLAARFSRRLAIGLTVLAGLSLVAEGYLGYVNDANRRALTSRSFAVAYARRDDLPPGCVVVSNIPAPAPPCLELVIQRRAKKARDLAELRTAYPPGTEVVYLYSPDAPIDRPLLDFLHGGRILRMDEKGVAVAITVPAEETDAP